MTEIVSGTLRAEQRQVSLLDRYSARSGDVLISGVQALVRLMLLQADRDAANGLRTGGFVSGYRGSPLGGVDVAFGSAAAFTGQRNIVVKPAVNEEMAATAIAGSQQILQTPGANVQGVFSLWYGKGPGFDRASDAIRHGVLQGASAHGGVVLAVGDDHAAKSSSITCYSDDVAAGLLVPLFYPSDAAEIVEYGLHGFALSRHTGAWTALKIITEVADSTRAVSAAGLNADPVLPPIEPPPMGLHNRWPETPADQEVRHVEHRLPAIAAYVRANGLDKTILKPPQARVGLVAAGKSYLDLREALRMLGLSEARMTDLGVAVYKPAMIWPLEREGLTEFAAGLEALIVVEEKGAFIERQAKALLYGSAHAPKVWGKHGPDGETIFPASGDLTPERIAALIGSILSHLTNDEQTRRATEHADLLLQEQARYAAPVMLRKPFFCSGCPHNTSTVVPIGSRATGGIGCHGLAAYNRPRTNTFAQMGGEGVHWMGLAPFTDEKHVFANMGDGTYFHSGLLAIRQAVAANLNITYKLLYNSAVAMTGGQPVDGELSVEQVVDQLAAEGVKTIIVSTDDVQRYPVGHPVRNKALRVEHRDEFEALQLELRDRPGVSVIVYDQFCATEKRRMRKRGKLPAPSQSVFINELVCEGCGDCSVKSNCLSVEPVETTYGTKRRINQSSCNKDYSCLKGFCPSFVTIEGGKPRRAKGSAADLDIGALPAPPSTRGNHERIVIAGVGGTGVVTIGALTAMSTHISGRKVGVLDQTGMAQKGGAVVSHVHIADNDDIYALRIPAGQADLVVICDQVVGNSRDVLSAISSGHTRVVVNSDVAITGDFTQNREATPDARLLARRLRERAGEAHLVEHPFTQLAERLFGDAIASNLMMLGLCYQQGWVGLDQDAFASAIELNGASVAMGKAAFAWGRKLALSPREVYSAAGMAEAPAESLDDVIERRATFLVSYQDQAYADRFRSLIADVREAEESIGGNGELTQTAARVLFRVMSYKDEYEVARLYTDGSFAAAVDRAFEGKVSMSFHMAPPLLASRDKATGHLRKRRFGSWLAPLLRLLANGKSLRGTVWDVFGRTAERRAERALIVEYEQLLRRIIPALRRDNLERAVKLAGLAAEVRGYGHVKEQAMERYYAALPEALAAFEAAAALSDQAVAG